MKASTQVKDIRTRLHASMDHYRALLHDWLDAVTEEEARRPLVPSQTTLLGLVTHAT